MATNEVVNNQLVDEAIDAYVDWQEERAHVWDAYARWESAGTGAASLAFSAYGAALDREEAASRVYAERVAHVTVFAQGQEPVAPIRRVRSW
jgi:hypothetical protein